LRTCRTIAALFARSTGRTRHSMLAVADRAPEGDSQVLAERRLVSLPFTEYPSKRLSVSLAGVLLVKASRCLGWRCRRQTVRPTSTRGKRRRVEVADVSDAPLAAASCRSTPDTCRCGRSRRPEGGRMVRKASSLVCWRVSSAPYSLVPHQFVLVDVLEPAFS
jgi:hypothetical protein